MKLTVPKIQEKSFKEAIQKYENFREGDRHIAFIIWTGLVVSFLLILVDFLSYIIFVFLSATNQILLYTFKLVLIILFLSFYYSLSRKVSLDFEWPIVALRDLMNTEYGGTIGIKDKNHKKWRIVVIRDFNDFIKKTKDTSKK